MPLNIIARPKSFDEVYGNEGILKSLKKLLEDKKGFPHAILFQGSSGCGKTTLARILAKELGCKDPIEVNAASMRGIDAVRDIAVQCHYVPLGSKSAVYIIDEVHQITPQGQDAFLKTLEDAPAHCYFILCTTNPNKIVKTIRNRCSMYGVELLGQKVMDDFLNSICKRYDIDVNDDLFYDITDASMGCPRQALILLDQVKGLSVDESRKTLSIAKDFGGDVSAEVIELCRALVKGAPWSKISKLYGKVDRTNPEGIRMALVGYLRSCILSSGVKEARRFNDMIEPLLLDTFSSGEAGLVSGLFKASEKIL